MFETHKHRERRQRFENSYANEWEHLLNVHIPGWTGMTPQDRDDLKSLATDLVMRKTWEATHDFVLTDEIIAVIAAQAALPILAFDLDAYSDLNAFIVSAKTMELTGERAVGDGLRSRDPYRVLGHTSSIGDVYVAWGEILLESSGHRKGSLVVAHECAHVLDYDDGTTNGTPAIDEQELLDDWVAVCSRIFNEMQDGKEFITISNYAATNVAEFFATVTESYFTVPVALANEVPELYDVLNRYYLQDTATRFS